MIDLRHTIFAVASILSACASFTSERVKEAPKATATVVLAGSLEENWALTQAHLKTCFPQVGALHAPGMPPALEARIRDESSYKELMLGNAVRGAEFLLELRPTDGGTSAAYFIRTLYQIDQKAYIAFVESVRKRDRSVCGNK